MLVLSLLPLKENTDSFSSAALLSKIIDLKKVYSISRTLVPPLFSLTCVNAGHSVREYETNGFCLKSKF